MTPQQERDLGAAMKAMCVLEDKHPYKPHIGNVTDAMCRIIEYLDGGVMTVSTALGLGMAGDDDTLSQAIAALDREELVCVVDGLIVWQQEADEWLLVHNKQGRLF